MKTKMLPSAPLFDYRYVRHPGYVGAMLFALATPILLGLFWSLLPGRLSALLMLVRTALEDRTLQIARTGYVDYTRRVRYRLLPALW